MAELRAYQRADVDRMAAILAGGQGVLHLSEMRTGKLVEFIELCRRLFEGGELTICSRILIVAPLSTLWNVQAEFKKWLGWPVYVNNPNGIAGAEEGHAFHGGEVPFVYAINKEKLRKPSHDAFAYKWDLVLFDEAHHFRGRKAKQTLGALRLAKQASRVVVATGTPSINGVPKDLWPLLKLVDPKAPAFWKYLGEVAAPVPSFGGGYMDEASPWKPGALETLKKDLAPQVLRRTYEEVRGELPNLIEQTIPLRLAELDPAHYAQYKQLETEWRTVVGDAEVEVPTKLALSLRLRQLAASPANLIDDAEYGERPYLPVAGGKVQAVADFAENLDGQFVVWTWHRKMATVVQEALALRGIETIAVTGAVLPRWRQQNVEEFRAGKYRALVATIPSLSEGITLDHASAALFAEQSWVPSENAQAAARILGPGQRGAPLVATFVLEDTIEALVQRVLSRKEAVNSMVTALAALIEEATHDGRTDDRAAAATRP